MFNLMNIYDKNKRFIRNNPKNLMDITENLPYNKA